MPAVVGTRWFCVGTLWLTLGSLAWAEVYPLAVDQGHCEAIIATAQPSDQFYLVVGSLADAAQSTQVTVHASPSGGPEYLPLDKTSPDPNWNARIEAQGRLLERLRRERPALDRYPPLASPAPSKIFHIFTGERDLESAANYQTVHADLNRVGVLAQVYLDRADRNLPGIDETSAEALRLFDQEIGPWAEKHLGRVLDVDRDGRFTILLTSKLAALQNGKVQVDGFVRGSDFFRELPAPFSNQCDMLYLNAALKPGPHLRTVMAHEYTHAVTFCEHALTPYRNGPTNLDEESWLNEGLSHLVENPREFGWSNLDHRISAFLARPERYPLVVADYFGAGLWRNPGTRGSTYLFLRSCQEQTDSDLVRRLIQSPLRGIANLEAATQKPFPALFRQACIDLLQPSNYGFLDKDQKGPLLCGPRFQEITLDGGQGQQTLAGTSAAFFLLHSAHGTHARIKVEANGPVQVTLINVPSQTPRLSVAWEKGADNLRLRLTAHHGDVWLRGAGWEAEQQPLSPIREFDQIHLKAGASELSAPFPMPAENETDRLFKVLGEDSQGRPVAAWLVWHDPSHQPAAKMKMR